MTSTSTSNLMNGSDFKLTYPNTKFYKLTNESECHHNFQFKDGLNVDILMFDPEGECEPGGLYFTELNKISCWISYINIMYIREVEICDDSIVKIEKNKFKTDKFILKNRQLLMDLKYWNDYDFCELSVKQNGNVLEFVKDQTPELCELAVKQNGNALEFVKDQTPELCELAVKQNGNALEFVKNQTHDLCLLAVKQYGYAFLYVREQTPELCEFAVKQNGNVLEFVKDQTPELCELAVKQNGFALQFVREQTPELCKLAVKQYGYVLKYVKEHKLQNYV